MDKVLVSIDPGMETGIFIGKYGPGKALQPVTWIQTQGGFDGVADWADGNRLFTAASDIVFERFTPRPMARSYRRDELEPLVIEGLVRTLRPHAVRFQPPGAMDLGPGLPASRRLLKRLGWWQTGSTVDSGDANDANAATLHALAFMRRIGHAPTLEVILPHLLGDSE